MITTYIGVGSNIEPEKHAQVAIDELKSLGTITKISTIYRSEPVGFSGSCFLNFVIELKTSYSLSNFSFLLREIENKWGRPLETSKNQNRTLDLDILLFGNIVSNMSPKIPRNDLFKFAFVIFPMSELNPELKLPTTGQTINEIKERFSASQILTPTTITLTI